MGRFVNVGALRGNKKAKGVRRLMAGRGKNEKCVNFDEF